MVYVLLGFIHTFRARMALEALHVSEVQEIHNNAAPFTIQQNSNFFKLEDGDQTVSFKQLPKKFMVMGHRGSGMNLLQSCDRRMKVIKENSILAFNAAGKFNLDFIEFDVQVTKDDCAIVFHDNFILTKEKGDIVEKRVTELTVDEFLSYGPQRESKNVEKPLLRKTKDGRIFEWKVENDDHLCTLEDVFQGVNHSLGFNIEFKFDDNKLYTEEELVRVIQVVLRVVNKYAKDRSFLLSTFQPDAARLIRKLQSTYPVFFLTNGGSEIFMDMRRNSIDEAIKLCLAGGLHGIVSEVKAILRHSEAIKRIKESNLSLISYGQLNNVSEVVYIQHLMSVDGVIVDLVQEITDAVSEFSKAIKEGGEDGKTAGVNLNRHSQNQISFLLKFVAKLIQP